MTIEHRLAIYGTLAPGRSNHAQVADIEGRWLDGTVRGRLYPSGWGAAEGYPAILLDDAADEVPVVVLESPELPNHWQRLDAFEGPGYRRVRTNVHTAEGSIDAFIYELSGR